MVLGSLEKGVYWNEGFKQGGAISYAWTEIHKFLRELEAMEYGEVVQHYINGIHTFIFKQTRAENSLMEIVGHFPPKQLLCNS